ncbi:DUF3047 domain-containing protein [Marinobacterium sedimentorum]|uniref:DUF3047 domain-containing protein n=1 Tax=Marinobacterium sedimentorum TaxID=2927804 RepID=UPI0020C69C1F|nr:DUF3047 domain-containing protein [Marinobacterium sedimentorum]MCP8689350.1 DUF3047 domain-containing protein [Marinobacterium sedimentorum]
MTTLLAHHSIAPLLPRILIAALLVSVAATVAAERLDVGQFSQGVLKHWEAEKFSGITEYQLETDSERGTVLGARSQGSASGLFRKIDLDLNATPWLHWSWKIDKLLQGADERTKAGDDYPARIYVVFSGGVFFWKTRALNYVWSSHQPIGSEWPNAYTGNARMIAVQSAETAPGQWRSEIRDVRADYRRLFGEEPGKVVAVALMTDTDNTGQSVKAWYGDIWFSESATRTAAE